MKWLDQQVSLYNTHVDNTGKPATYRQILLTEFAMDHDYFGQRVNDLDTIIQLRKLDRTHPGFEKRKKQLKKRLQCYTPAALLKTKEKGKVEILNRTGIMQLDFDFKDIKDHNLEELKKDFFELPFVCFCGLSCSGDGFYALLLIAEPERLSEYAEHCFEVLEKRYDIKVDTSKGKKVENLRYLSYDSKMLIREEPEPLIIKQFRKEEIKKAAVENKVDINIEGSDRILNGLNKIRNAEVGSRIKTIQKVAYTLGGLSDASLLTAIKQVIRDGAQYRSDLNKYLKCAEDCYAKGATKPFTQ